MIQIAIILLVLYIQLGIKRTVLKRRTETLVEDETGFLTNMEDYLIRYTLINIPYIGSIKIHKALVSDTGDLHDHPWNYMSIILWGGYWEWTQVEIESEKLLSWFIETRKLLDNGVTEKSNIKGKLVKIARWYSPGSVLFRKANIPHKLEIPEGKYSLSLIFTSYKWRAWGFMKNGKWQQAKGNSYD